MAAPRRRAGVGRERRRARADAVQGRGGGRAVRRFDAAAAALEAIGQGAAEPFGPVVVLAMDKAATAQYFAMAAELRNAGVAAEVYLGSAGMKAQLKYADKAGIRFMVLLGEDEAARGVVTVKDLRRQEQFEVTRDELAATLKTELEQQRAMQAN